MTLTQTALQKGMDLERILEANLKCGERIVAFLEAGLVQEWVRSSRLLALVEKDGEHALFEFVDNASFTDFSIDLILPVDSRLKCDLDTPSPENVNADVYIKITSHKSKYLWELPFGAKTNTFVSEILKAVDVESRRKGRGSGYFSWLEEYDEYQQQHTPGDQDDGTALNNTGCANNESPDIPVPRQSIAAGVAPIAARESVVRYQMAMREEAFTDLQTFRVFCGTWNVNGQPGPNKGIRGWLAVDSEPPDLYAIGFQELDLSKEAFLFNDTPREEEWKAIVINSLHSGAKYHKVTQVRLVGMLLFVFIQEKHVAYCRGVAVDTVGTGIMGKMGNKGGVAVRLELHSTSMCFVNSHLAAHVDEYQRRNQDYDDICARLSFNHFIPPKSIKDHDQVFWLGDLNYRITDMDTDDVKMCIEKKNWTKLASVDQLNQQRKLFRVFTGFDEGEIDFQPTYKYDPGTDNWDSSEKCRAPAWCDRVLWKGDNIKLNDYRSHMQLMLSDHKPVSAVFDVGVKVIDCVRYRKIYEDVMKKLDKLENEFLPQVSVDSTEVIFDVVRYLESQKRSLIIANTGQVPVQFEFIKKLNDSSYCKPWLKITPYADFIMPGDKRDVQLEVLVDKRTAGRLNSGQDQLYDILVLHLNGGKDLFITATGQWERSSFGCSINTLVQLKQPIRDVPVGRIVELESGKSITPVGGECFGIPKELWFLLDHLYHQCLDVDGLFQLPGLHAELLLIRDALDSSLPEKLPGSAHSVAETLMLFLESLPEPIIPTAFTARCVDCSSSYVTAKQIINTIPENHRNTFLYLCAFLKETLQHSQKNMLDPKTLATLFGPILLRDAGRGDDVNNPRGARAMQPAANDRKKAMFLYHFLVNDLSDA